MNAATLDELTSMAVFARVVELRSFSAAARELGLSKSAVSTRVSRLEASLGVRLMHRTTRKLSLTEAGLALYERCARIVQAADEAAEVAEDASSAPRGTLRVNAPVTFSQLYMGPVLASFLAAYPEVRVALTVSDRLVDLVEEGTDVAIRITRLQDSSLIARKLADDRGVVVASPDYLARRGTPEVPEDLVEHDCLRYSGLDARVEWRFVGPDGPYSVPVRGPLVASDGAVLREGAVAGLGLAVVPTFMVADDLAAGRLVIVLDDHRDAPLGVYAVMAERRHLAPKVRVFVDYLAARFAEPPWHTAHTCPPRPT